MSGTNSPTREKSSSASRVFCLLFFCFLLASPSDSKHTFPALHLIFGCCQMPLFCSTCSGSPCHDCFSSLKNQPSLGIFPLERSFHRRAGIQRPTALHGWWFLIFQQLAVASENQLFSHVSWLEKKQFDCLGIPWEYSEFSKHLSLSNSSIITGFQCTWYKKGLFC